MDEQTFIPETFTPGPWHADMDWCHTREHGIAICTGDGPRDWRRPIARVLYADDEAELDPQTAAAFDYVERADDTAETHANARLIAHAPTLYRALSDLYDLCPCPPTECDGSPWMQAWDAALHALLLARGEVER